MELRYNGWVSSHGQGWHAAEAAMRACAAES
jgi:hypothetical protein